MADLIFPGEAPLSQLGDTRLPENIDLVLWQGDSQEYFVVLTDDSATPVPIDLTGHTAQAVIRQTFGAATSYAFTCDITEPTNGKIRLYMSSATSATIPAGDYIWNFQITTPGGDVRTYLAGDVKVHGQVD